MTPAPALVVAVLGAQLVVGTAAVDPTGQTAPAARTSVAVVATIRGDAKVDARCVEEAVTGFLAAKGIPVTWSRNAPANRPHTAARIVSVDVNLSEPSRIALTFAGAMGEPPVTRQVESAGGPDDIGCEAVADVIESAVLALATAPVEPPRPPPPSAPLVAHSRATATTVVPDRYVFALSYVGETVAWNLVQSGVELSVGSPPLTAHQRRWFRLGYSFPKTVEADLAAARWQTLSIVPLAHSWLLRQRRLRMEIGSWFGADITYLQRLPLPGGPVLPADTTWVVGVRYGFDVTATVRTGEHSGAFASLRFIMGGAFWSLREGDETLFRPPWWTIHPALVVGARWL